MCILFETKNNLLTKQFFIVIELKSQAIQYSGSQHLVGVTQNRMINNLANHIFLYYNYNKGFGYSKAVTVTQKLGATYLLRTTEFQHKINISQSCKTKKKYFSVYFQSKYILQRLNLKKQIVFYEQDLSNTKISLKHEYVDISYER